MCSLRIICIIPVLFIISVFGHNSYCQVPDTAGKSSFSIRLRMIPAYGQYTSRYSELSNVNDDYAAVDFSYSVQDMLRQAGLQDSSLDKALHYMWEKYNELPVKPLGEKELFYSVWRSQLVNSHDDASIRRSMEEGTKTLLGMGYSDLGRDFMPFITGILEEQQLINYDPLRTKIFAKASRGVVSSVQILNTLALEDTYQNAGVCRDVHEMARQLLKTMSETYYEQVYPGKAINFDNYLFLQSWMTNRSHHVTLSMIDPLDTKKVYELDWGRVIERNNISNYANGRMYGNTYRVWQFKPSKQRSVPVDFRRTQFGKILDEQILSREEYMQFNGLYDDEDYSDITYRGRPGKFGKLSVSAGTYHPSQRFLIGSWSLTTRKRKVFFLRHSTTYALQGALQEDTRRKQLLYPQKDWDMTASLMGIPRVISKFETGVLRKGNFSFDAFINQQFDIFLILSSFKYGKVNEGDPHQEFSWSGDGNLSFSNGFRIRHSTKDRSLSNSLTLQARSCLLPNDIRLMTPNPATLFGKARILTPALDAITGTRISLNTRNVLSVNTVFEFTNMNSIIFSGTVSSQSSVSDKISWIVEAGATEQLKGMNYFWYPAARRQAGISLLVDRKQFSIGFYKYPESSITCSLGFRQIIGF
ncbi:MAG TPA: hypothetical protein VK155_10545 [Bacteroidales bacterium]|nr:hypothetical protein [Bacteroidales bacterium]